MLKLDLIKFDPLAHLLIVIVMAVQLYAMFTRPPDAEDADGVIERSDTAYQAAVFSSSSRGVLHQIFRQNEVDRELLKATLAACSR
jgi:hypothetical protein